MEVDGINLAVSGGAVTAIAGLAGAWIKARFGKTKVDPTPLPIDGELARKPTFVTVQECNRRMCEMRDDVRTIASGQEKIIAKLDELDERSEKRAIALNQRVDPMLEKLAETKGRVDQIDGSLRAAFDRATIGGKK